MKDHGHKPKGAGKSSFDLVDRKGVFGELRLRPGSTFLDLCCGRGAYSLAAAEIVGKGGMIYALDLWEEGIAALREEISARGIENIQAHLADVGRRIPVPDQVVDVCLMATVLHDLVEMDASKGALREVSRTLKPQGLLVVVEFKKIEGPPGPPIHIRLSPEEVTDIVVPFGFKKETYREAGPYTYLSSFSKLLLT